MKEILLFTAPWCEPCKAFKPLFFETAPQYPDINFRVVDASERTDIAKKYRVMSVPTMVSLLDGEYVDRSVDPSIALNISDLIERSY